jgi:DNA-binding NarL/FixJ family response regulator
VRHGEHQPAARAQHAPHRAQDLVEVGHVVDRQVGDDPGDALVGHRVQGAGVAEVVGDAERAGSLLPAGVGQQSLGKIDGGHFGAALGERAGDQALAAAKVEHRLATQVLGLIAGADDYVTKPFDPMELVARIKTMLRPIRAYEAYVARQADVNRTGWPFS